MSIHTSTNIPMHGPRAILTTSLVLVGCGSDRIETAPLCDDIGHPLGVAPVITPPEPEFAVECANGWGNAVDTRPALDTDAQPGEAAWLSLPHPDGGWIQVITPGIVPDYGWLQWLDAQGVDLDFIYANRAADILVWIRQDGSLGWALPELWAESVDLVGAEIWAFNGGEILVIDPSSGELLDERDWELESHHSVLKAASDPAGGAWVTTIEYRDHPGDLIDQNLYRATTIDAIEFVATRITEDMPGYSGTGGGVVGLPDGAAAWQTAATGFEVIEPDGSVRWTHPDGFWAYPDDFVFAHDADTMLVTSQVPTGVGAGMALRLEKVSIADGSVLWTREHRRYEVVEPENCGPDECTLTDYAYPILRPDGGYLLVGWHAYPSSTCVGQPLIMAVSADGDAEWAHRVETCGLAFRAALRDESLLEILGVTWTDDFLSAAWTRWFEL
jgi:hypothetical protein